MNGGEPGLSAARQAEAKKSRAEELRRQAARLEDQSRAWQLGVEGEVATAEALEGLTQRGWAALHDRAIPGSRVNIDHLVVGPPGVVVVDSKNYGGTVRVADGVAWRNGRRMDDDVDALSRYTAVVQDLIRSRADRPGAPPIPVRQVVVVHRAVVTAGWVGGTAVVAGSQLTRWLESLPVSGPPVDVGRVTAVLDRALIPRVEADESPEGADRAPVAAPGRARSAARPTRRETASAVRRRRRKEAELRRALAGLAGVLVLLFIARHGAPGGPGAAATVASTVAPSSVVGPSTAPSTVQPSPATAPASSTPTGPPQAAGSPTGHYMCDSNAHSMNLVVDSPPGVLRFLNVQRPTGAEIPTSGAVTLYGALPGETITLWSLPTGSTSWSAPVVLHAPQATC
ncbi:MAG TPA: NERD domain-containing protein [Acidimicrobiales bacterium]|nr:NERD domain-containing protein [Acidimicrobiales bacterium]